MTRHATREAPKIAIPKSGPAHGDGLEERIVRLEKRLEETIAPAEPAYGLDKQMLEDKEQRDPLRRAVDRASEKRGSGS